MRIDLKNPYNNEALRCLNTWRERYSKSEYPFKIVLNMFYRQYTMNSIWQSQLESSFNEYANTENDVLKSVYKLEIEYANSSLQFAIGDNLIDLMNKKEDIGSINYANNIQLISSAQNGSNKAVEELEFTYLYNFLCNKSILFWAAFGRKGFSKIDAIAQVTGAVIESNEPITYGFVYQVLGLYGVATTLNNLYIPLSNLYEPKVNNMNVNDEDFEEKMQQEVNEFNKFY